MEAQAEERKVETATPTPIVEEVEGVTMVETSGCTRTREEISMAVVAEDEAEGVDVLGDLPRMDRTARLNTEDQTSNSSSSRKRVMAAWASK